MASSVTQNEGDRTAIVAHYIIARARPDRLGAIKLNKVMWFADLAAYRRMGRTISGQRSYEKRQFGPVPNNIVISLSALQHEGKIVTREVPVGAAFRREHVWLRQPDVSAFSAEEVDLLNEAIDWVCNDHTAMSISELTHDKLWEAAEIGEQIPIGAATIAADEVNADDIAWAMEGMIAA